MEKVEALITSRPSDKIEQGWLQLVCQRTDEVLWDGYRFAMDTPDAAWPRIIFPKKGQQRRVGEHEARFAFIVALLADAKAAEWALAAEVPTKLSYRFAERGTGPKAQRALTDLALYRQSQDDPTLAVEFKSGGRSGKSERDESLRRDIAKVLAERSDALWFQVLRSTNSATLEGLLRSLEAAISRLSNPFRLSDYLAPGKTVEPRAKTIAFHICVLNPDMMTSIHRVLDYVPGKPEIDFFTIEATATRTLLEVADGQGWSVYRRAAINFQALIGSRGAEALETE